MKETDDMKWLQHKDLALRRTARLIQLWAQCANLRVKLAPGLVHSRIVAQWGPGGLHDWSENWGVSTDRAQLVTRFDGQPAFGGIVRPKRADAIEAMYPIIRAIVTHDNSAHATALLETLLNAKPVP